MITRRELDHQFHSVAKLHHECIHKLAGERGFPIDPRIFFELHRNPGMSQKGLAEKLKITPASVTALVQKMEQAGFIQREVDEQDKRFIKLYLTQKSIDNMNKMEQVIGLISDTIYDGFTEDEKDQLSHFFDRIYKNLMTIKNN